MAELGKNPRSTGENMSLFRAKNKIIYPSNFLNTVNIIPVICIRRNFISKPQTELTLELLSYWKIFTAAKVLRSHQPWTN